MITLILQHVISRIEKSKNVVVATNQANLYEELENIQQELVICEKALAEYLETKRLAFPRFYFVSGADLLDILSNGNMPPLVCKHMTKLFDSLANLRFSKDLTGSETKTANAMWSKDGELVPFPSECDCSGQVEVWLNRVLDIMRATVLHDMSEATAAYEDKPRDQWVLDFPAQVALCGTQIWWTAEVNISFGRLEEGYEHALKDYFKKQVPCPLRLLLLCQIVQCNDLLCNLCDQVGQLNSLITMLVGELSKGDRQKIMTICTIDVHARDVVTKMINTKVDNSQVRSRVTKDGYVVFSCRMLSLCFWYVGLHVVKSAASSLGRKREGLLREHL